MEEVVRFKAALDIIRHRCGSIVRSQQIVLFLAVLQQPGVTMPEIVRILDMPQGSVSRNVKALSRYPERRSDRVIIRGAGLLDAVPDRNNPQSLALFPTSLGRAVGREIAAALASGRTAANRIGGGRAAHPATDAMQTSG